MEKIMIRYSKLWIVFLFSFCIMNIYAFGKSEEQYRRELEQYPIQVSLYLPTTISLEYVFIDTDRIILIKNDQLTEINLTTNEQKAIETPENWPDGVSIRDPKYDRLTNTVHTIYLKPRRNGQPEEWSFFILHLDDYRWEEVGELRNEIMEYFDSYFYDSVNMLIYYPQYKRNEYRYVLKRFDLSEREFLDDIELPLDIRTIYHFYGDPLKILATVAGERINGRIYDHFIIFDVATGTRTDYTESIPDEDTDFIYLYDYIPLADAGCFLGVKGRTNGIEIAVMDLTANTIETVALEGFPYYIYNFRRIAEGKYSFLVPTRTRGGFQGPRFLCFFDYP